jgi:hypothetical protein
MLVIQSLSFISAGPNACCVNRAKEMRLFSVEINFSSWPRINNLSICQKKHYQGDRLLEQQSNALVKRMQE